MGSHFLLQWDLLDSGIENMSPALAGGFFFFFFFFTAEPPGKPTGFLEMGSYVYFKLQATSL